MDSKDQVGPPVRRPSWTGALGAKLGRILSAGDEHGDEEKYRALEDDESVGSLRKGFGSVVVVGRQGGE